MTIFASFCGVCSFSGLTTLGAGVLAFAAFFINDTASELGIQLPLRTIGLGMARKFLDGVDLGRGIIFVDTTGVTASFVGEMFSFESTGVRVFEEFGVFC